MFRVFRGYFFFQGACPNFPLSPRWLFGQHAARMPTFLSSPYDLLFCRPGAEEELIAECSAWHGLAARPAGPGMLMLPPGKLPATPLVFERQRMPNARLIAERHLQPLPDGLGVAIWENWLAEPMPWGLHLFALEEEEGGLARRLPGIARILLKQIRAAAPGCEKWERKPEKLFLGNNGQIHQWALSTEGLWVAAAPPAALTSPKAAGRYRMRMDPDAPSRSYLKMEEALDRLGIEPREGESVIDLGAAPGGWTYAFAKRGCQVTAVDNGPLRLPGACVRRVEHVHADGMTWHLPPLLPPVDWLVGDMLIPPGKAFHLLKYWVGGKHCRRLVLNIKLPQEQPVPVLEPILAWLRGKGSFQVRQLYHDRREVTVFGSANS